MFMANNGCQIIKINKHKKEMKTKLFTLCLMSCIVTQAQTIDSMAVRLQAMADSLTANLKPWAVPDEVFPVEKYGAIGDGKTLCTQAIQKAIDACSKTGGGTVLLSKGSYVTGTIELKSGVMLCVDDEAKLLGSLNLDDYPERKERLRSVMSEMHKYRLSLIYAEGAEKVGICGRGEIDFRGTRENFPGPETIGEIVGRPFGIRMIQCRNVVLKDITLRNAAAWMQNYLACEDLIFDGIQVYNLVNVNNDGLDPDGCRNVVVRNCRIKAEDDAFCLKGASGLPTENVLVENCTFLSTCNALKIGTDTQGDFRNILVRNVMLGGFGDKTVGFRDRDDCSTGITLETVDGGNVENIVIQNADISNSRCPVYVYIGDRGRVIDREKPKAGYLRNILIQNVTGRDNRIQGSLITGIPEQHVEHIAIRNVWLEMQGGGTQRLRTGKVPLRTRYPDAQSYCRYGLPAYGFYVRHADSVTLDNVHVIPTTEEAREMIIRNK